MPLNLHPSLSATFSLLYFLMGLMFAAIRAKLAEFQPLGHGLLVLGLAVVLSLALGALHCNDFAHGRFRSLSVAQNSESREVRIQKGGIGASAPHIYSGS